MRFQLAPARILAALGALAVVAIVVAGCGGGSDSTSSGGGSTGTSTGGGEESSSSALFPKAAKANEEFETRPTSIGIETPVEKSIPKGKVIDFIQCAVPACATEREIFEEATDVLGWKLKSINAGSTPEEIKAAYQQAINDKPDAVLGSGNPKVLFEPEVKQLDKLGIPVVEAFVEEEAGGGVTAVIGGIGTSEFQGKMMADYILANLEDEEAEVGVVNVKGFETVTATAEKVEEVIGEECSGCTTKRLDAPVTSIGSDLPQRISSFFTSNPGIDWATVGYNDMVTGLPTALKGAGVEDVKLTTVNINTSIAPYLANGEYLQGTMGTSFPEVYWRVIDFLVRQFNGESTKEQEDDSTLPYWTITKETLPTTDEEFPVVTDYQEQFKKLWGVE
ncbi:MAG TPA: substrate-binding domain-containing protein [Solirubrobacterales bacterium]|nr:substrate-binding domain-containing protein [Solirubrobacterales bacterium]